MTREAREGKESRKKILIGIILIGIMIFSIAGFAFFQQEEPEEKIKYKGIKFVFKQGLWYFEIQGMEFATVYNPIEIGDFPGTLSFNLQNFVEKPLFFSQDSSQEGISEIMRNIGRFALRTQYVCLEVCEKDLPIKNCNENVIIVREANESLIKQEESCIYILGDDIIKASDAFIFKVLGLR